MTNSVVKAEKNEIKETRDVCFFKQRTLQLTSLIDVGPPFIYYFVILGWS